jgi:hypothetical protein
LIEFFLPVMQWIDVIIIRGGIGPIHCLHFTLAFYFTSLHGELVYLPNDCQRDVFNDVICGLVYNEIGQQYYNELTVTCLILKSLVFT